MNLVPKRTETHLDAVKGGSIAEKPFALVFSLGSSNIHGWLHQLRWEAVLYCQDPYA